jgi:MscS family membrane protein
VKDTINCRIAERFAKEGIEIPFPQMDVHMKK